MQSDNRLLDGLARLMTEAMGAAEGARGEVETFLKSRAERLVQDLDLVTREEFDAMAELARCAHEDRSALEARVAALEAQLFELVRLLDSPEPNRPAPRTRPKRPRG